MTDIIHYFQSLDIFSWQIISLLIIAGFLVGFINTMAGSGTVISYSIFMMLGLPANIANGTIRLGVIMQTLAASLTFRKQHVLDIKKGLWLSISVVTGTILGAQIAVSINEDIFELVVGIVMIMMLFFIFIKPERWIKGKAGLIKEKPTIVQFLIFFLIGIYGGFIHIGIGIFLLGSLVLSAGYDLVKANALKVFIVLLSTPFALIIFMYNNQVDYAMGLIAAIGNIFGGLVASHYAVSWGAGIIRWILIAVIVLYSLKLFGFYKLLNL